MQKLDIEKIKKYSFDVLCEFKIICEKYNLKYSLSGGTLLGAVKYKGFIPWDDDIDVMMPRTDYDKLIQLARSEEFSFILYSKELQEERYGYPFAKACHRNTMLREFGINDRNEKLGVYIDIFPLDGMGNTILGAKIHYNIFKFWQGIQLTTNWTEYHFSKRRKWYYEPIRFCCYILGKVIPEKKTAQILNKLNRKYLFDECIYAGRLTGDRGNGEIHKRTIFDKTIKMEFEGMLFEVIAEYDLFLKSLYGNYLEDIPVEKQVSHHNFEAFEKELL